MFMQKCILFFKNLFPKDRRSLFCFFLSTLFHLSLILILCILVLPQKGQEGTDMVDVTFSSEGVPESKETQDTSIPSTSEENFFQKEVSQESLEEMKDILKLEESQESEKYLSARQEKIEQKKKSLEAFSQQQKKIEKGIQQRSRYGTLKPRTFYGIAVFARSMVFILDISGSMDIDEAKRQLQNAYHSLKEEESFSIIVYSDQIQIWQRGLVYASKENKQKADEWLQTIQSGGATDIYGALQNAFEIAYKKTKAETMYFLSDGLPTAGIQQDPLLILSAVKKWNQEKKITIHTIGLGPHQDSVFLSRLAQENQGKYFVR